MEKVVDKEKQGHTVGKGSGDDPGVSPKTEKVTESASGLSVERYREFLENISDGVYETDIHGNFTYFNDALCKVFGHPRDKIQARNYHNFMDTENARSAYDAFTKVWVTHKGFSDIVWEVIDLEGKTRVIELSANLIKNEKGKKIGFRGIARDVTEKVKIQRALQESEFDLQCQYEVTLKAEKQYKTLLDFVPYPMVVSSLEGDVQYVNPSFTRIFGWDLHELEGKKIPYIPQELEQETRHALQELTERKLIHRLITRRLTKDGEILDVVMRGAVYSEDEYGQGGQLVFLRNITEEKRLARINEALLRISLALPRYPELEDLLHFLIREVKELLNVEGVLIILLDEEKNEFYLKGAAYDNRDTERRAKEIRFPADKGVAGKVIRTGKETIIPDVSVDPDYYPVVDQQLGFQTHSMMDVPLRARDKIIGVVAVMNKKESGFNQKDVELLNMIAGTVALSIENARFSEELKRAYNEVTSLNRAKDKVINHLSHELKTPVSVLMASLNILSKKLESIPRDEWHPTMERAERNLDRILEMQYQVEDIMRDQDHPTQQILSVLLEECSDELESLVAEEVGEGPLVERISKRIQEIFLPKEIEISEIFLDRFVGERIEQLKPEFSHREMNISINAEPVPSICVPSDVMIKVFDGLVKNAVENTPDEGRIEVRVQKKGEGSELVVHDYGIGIREEYQKRIFEGFFMTQDTMAYSSKRPFDFNAGGKGADLLRMKIFAERYNFRISMASRRCPSLPTESDICPGRISQCKHCQDGYPCHERGGTTFTLFFPPSPDQGCFLGEEG